MDGRWQDSSVGRFSPLGKVHACPPPNCPRHDFISGAWLPFDACVTCHISIATFFQNWLSPKRINHTKVLPLLEIQWPIRHAHTSSCSWGQMGTREKWPQNISLSIYPLTWNGQLRVVTQRNLPIVLRNWRSWTLTAYNHVQMLFPFTWWRWKLIFIAIEICELKKDELDALVKKTRLIITTIGPYMKYGEPVIEACANNGTHYLDWWVLLWWPRP